MTAAARQRAAVTVNEADMQEEEEEEEEPLKRLTTAAIAHLVADLDASDVLECYHLQLTTHLVTTARHAAIPIATDALGLRLLYHKQTRASSPTRSKKRPFRLTLQFGAFRRTLLGSDDDARVEGVALPTAPHYHWDNRGHVLYGNHIRDRTENRATFLASVAGGAVERLLTDAVVWERKNPYYQPFSFVNESSSSSSSPQPMPRLLRSRSDTDFMLFLYRQLARYGVDLRPVMKPSHTEVRLHVHSFQMINSEQQLDVSVYDNLAACVSAMATGDYSEWTTLSPTLSPTMNGTTVASTNPRLLLLPNDNNGTLAPVTDNDIYTQSPSLSPTPLMASIPLADQIAHYKQALFARHAPELVTAVTQCFVNPLYNVRQRGVETVTLPIFLGGENTVSVTLMPPYLSIAPVELSFDLLLLQQQPSRLVSPGTLLDWSLVGVWLAATCLGIVLVLMRLSGPRRACRTLYRYQAYFFDPQQRHSSHDYDDEDGWDMKDRLQGGRSAWRPRDVIPLSMGGRQLSTIGAFWETSSYRDDGSLAADGGLELTEQAPQSGNSALSSSSHHKNRSLHGEDDEDTIGGGQGQEAVDDMLLFHGGRDPDMVDLPDLTSRSKVAVPVSVMTPSVSSLSSLDPSTSGGII